MKKVATIIGTALLLVGCGQNDSGNMGGAADYQSGSDSSTTESPGNAGGIDSGINGTGASGNGSGGTASSDARSSDFGQVSENDAPVAPDSASGDPADQTNRGESNDQVQQEAGSSQDFSKGATAQGESGQTSEDDQDLQKPDRTSAEPE
jgi:hypothetical protein